MSNSDFFFTNEIICINLEANFLLLEFIFKKKEKYKILNYHRILYPSIRNLITHTFDHQETEIVRLKNLSKSRDTDKKVVFLPYFSSHVFLMSLQLFFF